MCWGQRAGRRVCYNGNGARGKGTVCVRGWGSRVNKGAGRMHKGKGAQVGVSISQVWVLGQVQRWPMARGQKTGVTRIRQGNCPKIGQHPGGGITGAGRQTTPQTQPTTTTPSMSNTWQVGVNTIRKTQSPPQVMSKVGMGPWQQQQVRAGGGKGQKGGKWQRPDVQALREPGQMYNVQIRGWGGQVITTAKRAALGR